MSGKTSRIPNGIENQTSEVSQKSLQLPQQALEPISPATAVEMYLSDRKRELRSSSLNAHKSALNFFEQWCEEQDIHNLNEMTGRLLHQYRVWRRDEATVKVDTLSKKSEKDQQDIIRAFIRYCESIDAVRPELHEQVQSPTIPREEAAREHRLKTERANEILSWLRKYEFASLEHVVWELFTDHGPRTGTIHSLDVDDYHPGEDPPYLSYEHRPDRGTKLKKGNRGKRFVAVTDGLQEVLKEFLENKRPDVTDDYGRRPLLATQQGRLAKSTIRKYIYKWTRPCKVGNGCPHSREKSACEAIKANSASKCPSSLSPHAIRRGYITYELKAGLDRSYVSERCNVSEEIIKLHYDGRDEHERLQVRQWALENTRRDSGEYGGER